MRINEFERTAQSPRQGMRSLLELWLRQSQSNAAAQLNCVRGPWCSTIRSLEVLEPKGESNVAC